MARLPSVQLARKPRMADFARILAAVDAELGTGALERYAQQAARPRRRRPVGRLLRRRIQAVIADSFEGTSAELLAEVKPSDPEWKRAEGLARLGARRDWQAAAARPGVPQDRMVGR